MEKELAKIIFDTICSCVPKTISFPISIHEPSFLGNEWKYVKECIDTGWVSSVGHFVDKFEQMLAEYTGVKHAVAVVNGTAALHMCLKLLDVQANDEVLVPAMTFVATANAVAYCGAIPHFVDIEERTLGVDPFKLSAYLETIAVRTTDGLVNKRTGRRIKALIAMHTFGHPVDLDPLMDVCQTYGLEVVEDAAEALGTLYKGKHVGHWGKLAALSFNGNKIVTTGGGGAILTNDSNLAKTAKHLTTTAKIPHPWRYDHDQIGYNYRLPNINAALGCAQMENLPHFLKQKRMLSDRYKKGFEQVTGVRFFEEPPFARSNYWLNAILLDPIYKDKRDDILDVLTNNGIMVRPAWTLMHHLPMYRDCPRMVLSTAEDIQKRLINLPSSAFLGENGE